MPTKYLAVDGHALYVHHTGPTTRPDRPPAFEQGETVLLIHCAGGNGEIFSGVMAALAGDHSPVAFDLPAHGRSSGLDAVGSIEKMARLTEALAGALEIERPVLFGLSMGAAVALECAISKPDAIGGLVLCSGGPDGGVPDERLDLYRRVTEGKERRPFLRELFSKDAKPEILRAWFGQDLKTDPRATHGDLVALSEWSAADRLDRVSVPTLVLSGLDDPSDGAAALVSGIADATHVEIPGAGHLAPFEQPEATAAAVAEFLGGLS